MNIKKAIEQHIDKHGSGNAVVLVMSYDDELLLAARSAIQKIAPVKMELLTFPRFYNELDTEKMIEQINEAQPTLIVNAADKEWLEQNVAPAINDIDCIEFSEDDLRTLAYGYLHFLHT